MHVIMRNLILTIVISFILQSSIHADTYFDDGLAALNAKEWKIAETLFLKSYYRNKRGNSAYMAAYAASRYNNLDGTKAYAWIALNANPSLEKPYYFGAKQLFEWAEAGLYTPEDTEIEIQLALSGPGGSPKDLAKINAIKEKGRILAERKSKINVEKPPAVPQIGSNTASDQPVQ